MAGKPNNVRTWGTVDPSRISNGTGPRPNAAPRPQPTTPKPSPKAKR